MHMDEITVTDWLPYDEAEGMTESLGGCGGMMDARLDEASYRALYAASAQPYVTAIFRALDDVGPIGGATHQESHCPVFSDGTVATFSQRGGGDLVAAWWNTRFPDDVRDYCAFAWDYGEESAQVKRWRESVTGEIER